MQIIQEQEDYIKQIEAQYNVSRLDFPGNYLTAINRPGANYYEKKDWESDLNIITEEKQRIGSDDNIQDKNLKISKLKKLIEEDKKLITSMTIENSVNSRKLIDFELVSKKSTECVKELEETKEYLKNQISFSIGVLKEKDHEINARDSEMQDVANLLKKSHEKRQYSHEYNIFLETNNSKLIEKLNSLKTEKKKILEKVEDLQKNIMETEQIFEESQSQLTEIEENLLYLREKNKKLALDLEATKESVKTLMDKNDSLKVRYLNAKEKLKAIKMKNHDKRNTRERASSKKKTGDQGGIKEIIKEEIARLEEKHANLRGKVDETRKNLQKLSEIETYLKNSLMTKEIMISEIESLIKFNEENQKRLTKSSRKEIKAKNFAELITLLEEMKYQYKSSEELIKCFSCFKVPDECYLAYPCVHLSCLKCKDEFEILCPQCSSKVECMVHSKHLDDFVANLRKEIENVDKAKKFIENLSILK